jgi:hypothetical protein
MNLGSFAAGLGTGALTAHKIDTGIKREKREETEFGLRKQILELGVDRAKKEQPVLDKELQVRGAKADFDLAEQKFTGEMQAFEQQTRRVLAQTQQQQAVAGQQRLPDELRVAREDLNNKVLEAVKRQTANIWGVAKMGNTDMALEMYNGSMLVEPGQKAKAIRFEEVDVPGADGKPGTKAKVMVIEPEAKGGKARKIPVTALEQLYQQYGAKYEKVGNDIVRVGRDGTVTPVYQTDKFQHTPDGDVYSERTGNLRHPAAGGLGGGTPAPGSGRAKKIDDRVKMAIDKVIMPKFGGRFEGGLFFPDEKNKDIALRATELAGQYVRGGMDPEAAGAKAVKDAEREQALKPKNPGDGYNGPKPWKK